jgi:hypothetical protein
MMNDTGTAFSTNGEGNGDENPYAHIEKTGKIKREP